MKTLNKTKLNNLSAENLSEKQMKEIKGGSASCYCGCYYAGQGGSTTSDNLFANCDVGLWSPYSWTIGGVCF